MAHQTLEQSVITLASIASSPGWQSWIFGLFLLAAVAGIAFHLRRVRRLESSHQSLRKAMERQSRQIESESQRVEQINSIISLINSEIDFDKVLDLMLRVSRVLSGVDMAVALVKDPKLELFRPRAALSWEASELEGIAFTPMQIREAYLDNARETYPDIFLLESGSGQSRRLTLTYRIRGEGQVEGYLVFESPQGEALIHGADLEMLHDLREHIRSAFLKAKLVQDLERLNQAKNEFVGIAAHDLRTPLGVIGGWVTLAIEQIAGADMDRRRVLAHLDKIKRASEEMERLVRDLLDISAIEAGQVNLETSRLNLRKFIESMAESHVPIAEKKGILLVVDETATPVEVVADGHRIGEVIDNLLSNAIKYTQPGGEVHIGCERVNGEVVTHVRDTGQGLTDEDMKYVFRTFRKLSARPTGGEMSTGLGLAIVKKLVEIHGGSVWVRSRQGEGSTFSFSLPAAG